MIVDGGVRVRNDEAAAFLGGFDNFLTTDLTSFSFTPRIASEHTLFGLPSKAIAGVDFYDSTYRQDRGLHAGDAPIHSYRLRQRMAAGYAPGEAIEAGVRPTMRFASAPMASTRRVLASIATTDGSLITIPRSRTWTRVLAVPRSIPMSREKRPRKRSSMTAGSSFAVVGVVVGV